MAAGISALVAFNFADAWFIAQLGTRQLAAFSFTFPVLMFAGAIAMGLGMGVSSVVARAIGEGNFDRVRRLTTDALLLGFMVVGVLACVGILTIDPLFRVLGADPGMIDLIRQYMVIWYGSIAVLIVPMMGNNAIRATGDAITPSLLMTFAFVVNIALDPILIYGLWGFPRLELLGAALATAIARGLATILALWVLYRRYKLIALHRPRLREIWESWCAVLYVAIPSIATNLVMPTLQFVLTRLAAGLGTVTVAAVGAGVRIEGLP